MAKKGIRKILKVLAYVVGAIIALLLIVVILLNTQFGQDIVRRQAIKFLKEKTNTEISLGNLRIKYPFSLPRFWMKLLLN